MTLERSDLYQGTLTLNFVNATNIEAGKPYIIKWNTQSTDYVENPEFTDVTISNSHNPVETDFANFVGVFSPTDIYTEEKTYLYLGADNTLYRPSADVTLNSCRAYFRLTERAAAVRAFNLSFGEEETTGIVSTTDYTNFTDSDDVWYDLSGRRLSGKPTVKGVYIHGGKKRLVK